MQPVNLFTTKTFIGIVIAYLSLILPDIETCLQNSCQANDYISIIIGSLGGLYAIYGRYAATRRAFTPKGFPGVDKEQVDR